MEIITEEKLNTRFPKNNNIDLSKVNNDIKQMYFSIYEMYTQLLNQYLITRTSLIKFDKKIANSELAFKAVDYDEKDFYQAGSTGLLDYFYVRNNLHIERLDSNSVKILLNQREKGIFTLTQESEKIIKSTISQVIFEPVENVDTTVNINFGPISEGYYAPNNALVLGVRHNDNIFNASTEKEFNEMIERSKFLNELCVEASETLSKELGMQVSVIEYNANSVKKNESIEKLSI